MISYLLPQAPAAKHFGLDAYGLARLGALPRTLPYGKAGGRPVLLSSPRDEWPARAGTGQRIIRPHCTLIKDQRFNDCTCNMATSLVETLRLQQGLPAVALSATAVYAHINGGRDLGSNLHDAANYIRDVGCVPVSMWPVSTWRMREPAHYAETAQRYQGLEWVDIPDAGGVITGIGWFGRPVGIGVRWGVGGHAVKVVDYAYRAQIPRQHLAAYSALVREFDREDPDLAELCGSGLDGDQIWFQIQNSWGEGWGENGFGWLPWSQVDSGVRTRYGGICVTSVTYTLGQG